MILIIDGRIRDFSEIFWNFIREGEYRCGWRNSQDIHFYRFTDPKPGFPVQIELFSRNQEYQLSNDTGIIPIHIDDDVSSLSAILLNDDFYRFMIEGKRLIDGISVLDAAYLIPFKMFAWLDLKEQKLKGIHVNERDLKKHKYDVFRLLEIVPNDTVISVYGKVRDSIADFLNAIRTEQLPLSQIGLTISQEEGIEFIKRIYLPAGK